MKPYLYDFEHHVMNLIDVIVMITTESSETDRIVMITIESSETDRHDRYDYLIVMVTTESFNIET